MSLTIKELKEMILQEKKNSIQTPSVLLAYPESGTTKDMKINEEADGMPKIITSPSGFYVGIISLDEETGVGIPAEKLTGYFRTKQEAEMALEEIKTSLSEQ